MLKEEPIQLPGTVNEALPGDLFRVGLPNGHVVLAHVSSKLRKNAVRIGVGDRVKVEVSLYDLGRGRIISHQE